MKLEDMKYEMKGMPDDMRKMVENEVDKQIKGTKKKFSSKRIAIAVLAAVLAAGTTAVAGTQLRKMYISSKGNYGVVTEMKKTHRANSSEGAAKVEYDIPDVQLKFKYLPKGMIENQKKYSFKDTPNKGGISPVIYKMDMGDDAFEILDTDVIQSENITVGDREGVYLEVAVPDDKNIWFDKRVYIYYPDVHHILELYIGEDVTKEEALKIAKGAELKATDNPEKAEFTWAWSDYSATRKGDSQAVVYKDAYGEEVPKDIVNVYKPGETFCVTLSSEEASDVPIDTKIADVKVCDDISLLDPQYVDEELYEETDENGKFLQNKINYIKMGDGIDSIDKTVNSSMSDQKLIYVTVEYTNNTGKDLTNVLFMGEILKAVEDNSSYKMYRQVSSDGSWDEAVDTSKVISSEMVYYDIHNGERKNNYIGSLKAGETKTVHMGFVVNAEELPCLFLCFDIQSGGLDFRGAVRSGLVDIRCMY